MSETCKVCGGVLIPEPTNSERLRCVTCNRAEPPKLAGFYDDTCNCGAHVGWFGRLSDRPPCSKCGHSVNKDQLLKEEKELDAFSDNLLIKLEEHNRLEFLGANELQLRLYAEGQADADKHETRGHALKVPPSKTPNPYYATKTKDGRFWSEHSKWWMKGWHDAEAGRDRRNP